MGDHTYKAEKNDRICFSLNWIIVSCCKKVVDVIGERSDSPSDKLGDEIFISSRVLVCLSLCIVYVWPDNQYHAHSHDVHTHTLLFMTLCRGNQITIETESE